MRSTRFAWKLYTGYAVLLLGSIVTVCLVVNWGMSREIWQETAHGLHQEALLLQDMARAVLREPESTALQQRLYQLGVLLQMRCTVIRTDGTVAADSAEDPARMDNHAERPEVIAARTQGRGLATRASHTLGERMMYFALPLYEQGQLSGYVRTAVPVTLPGLRLARLRFILMSGLGSAALLGLLGGYVFIRHRTRPLDAVTTAVASLAGTDPGQSAWPSATDELTTLSAAVTRVGQQLHERMETLSREHNQLLAILGSMIEGVVAVDRNERVVHMNQAAGTILHAVPEACIGRPIWEMTRVRAVVEMLSDIIRGAGETVREARIVEQLQDQVIALHASPLRSSTGALAGALVVLHDVTELRRLENVRREFVANVSHELKTPVTAIKGFVETLYDGALDDRVQAERFLSIVARHAERLHAIIEDLLSLSRLEQEEETTALPRTDTALTDVLQAAVQDCAAKAAARQVTVLTTCAATLHARINAPLIEQAVVNLLDNAINYSKPGSAVWLEAALEDAAVVMRVRDEGIGIPQQHQSRIFERFYRVDKARSREHGGTGLGLAIVKHIALVHGGQVSVTSAVGKGSTFTLTLPLTTEAPPRS
jgi:two-component system, OmpR family, phosphate regulon sensor histidine kinase PhoR